jgi:hypothetical protein
VIPGDAILPDTDVEDPMEPCTDSTETRACHSYHTTADGIKVASIPTILQFYFAFMYSGVDEHRCNTFCV